MKLYLSNVTLLGIDCVNVERLQAAMDVCVKEIEFSAVKLLTSLPTTDSRKIEISPLNSVEDYSKFCIEELHKYVDTDFVLIVQYDGFILNPHSWNEDFLKYDYIGAPWLVADWSVERFDFPKGSIGTEIVGNGGFSLRSKKFLEITAKLAEEGKLPKLHPEDVSLCVWNRELMESEGIRFASVEVAEIFSIESEDWTYAEQFGFHGLAWTNIDKWIDDHPELSVIVDGYRKARYEAFKRHTIRARDKIFDDLVSVYRGTAIEAHSFGSTGRGDSDELSDIDIWFTFRDEDVAEALKNRLRIYSKVGEVIHLCEPPQNSPVGGMHSFILYKTSDGLQQVDCYICPQSTSFMTNESKNIFGNIGLPKKELSLNPQKIAVQEDYHIDFFITFIFIAIKNLVRTEQNALEDMLREYDYLRERYDISIAKLNSREDSFDVLHHAIDNLKLVSNERQRNVLSEIEKFSNKVQGLITN